MRNGGKILIILISLELLCNQEKFPYNVVISRGKWSLFIDENISIILSALTKRGKLLGGVCERVQWRTLTIVGRLLDNGKERQQKKYRRFDSRFINLLSLLRVYCPSIFIKYFSCTHIDKIQLKAFVCWIYAHTNVQWLQKIKNPFAFIGYLPLKSFFKK
jgi:hypothetical protein